MIDYLAPIVQGALANWERTLVGGAIVISSLIVFLGALKPILFDRIKNKDVRGTLLFVTSLVLVLPFTAVYLVMYRLIYGVNFFEYYWVTCIALMPATVFVYSLYEHTHLRNIIQKIGEKTWEKILVVLCAKVVEDENKKTHEKLISASKELKDFTKATLKNTAKSVLDSKKTDNEFNNL